MTPAAAADRVVIMLSAGVALFAVVARVHNVVAYPAIYDWDAAAHAVNVVDLLEMRLPNPRSWAGTHPPLYHALGAGLWALLPDAVPVHVLLRLLSAAAWIATVALVWRALGRLGFRVEGAIVGALLLGVPGIVIASCMMTNDTLCALFITATLALLLEAPRAEPAPARHVALSGLLAGLAAMTKATGLPAIAIAAAFHAWRARRRPLRAVRDVLLVGLVAAAIAGPHYARVALTLAGSPHQSTAPQSRYNVPPYNLLGGYAASAEKEVISLVVLAVLSAQESSSSVALLHEAMWGDPTAVFLPPDPRTPVSVLSAAGLVVVALALVGALRLLARRDIARRAGIVLLFGAAYAAALLPPSVAAPYMILTKTNFFLPLALPMGLVLALGLDALRGRFGAVLRGALLLIAAGGVALTWYGWWEERRPTSSATRVHGGSRTPAVLAVERYFAYRANDPIRAVRLLAPDAHLAHELRLVRILRIPFAPERGLAPEDERSLELARARQAWLELYNLIRWMQPITAALDVTVLDVDQHADTAHARVRVAPLGATAPPGASLGLWPFPHFDQHFSLQRVGAEWRITGITQTGVPDESAVPAFAGHPTLARLEHLRALGWRPSWEDAVASAVGSLP